MAIKFQNRINTMIWTDRGISSLIPTLYLTICQFHNKVEVEFLPVHHPTPEEIARPGKNGLTIGGTEIYNASPELFAENVRQAVSKATGIPTSNYSLEDLVLCRRAEKLGLPYSAGLVFFPTLQHELQ